MRLRIFVFGVHEQARFPPWLPGARPGMTVARLVQSKWKTLWKVRWISLNPSYALSS
jgi:hypothetical protein